MLSVVRSRSKGEASPHGSSGMQWSLESLSSAHRHVLLSVLRGFADDELKEVCRAACVSRGWRIASAERKRRASTLSLRLSLTLAPLHSEVTSLCVPADRLRGDRLAKARFLSHNVMSTLRKTQSATAQPAAAASQGCNARSESRRSARAAFGGSGRPCVRRDGATLDVTLPVSSPVRHLTPARAADTAVLLDAAAALAGRVLSGRCELRC